MSDDINHDRRRFFGAVAMAIAAAQFGMISSAVAQTGTSKPPIVPPIKPGINKSFGPLKQIDAELLNVGYAEMGPSGGPPVILLREAIRVRGDSCPRRFVSEVPKSTNSSAAPG